ncbi:DUF3280 domain-containing protein [Rhodoblastus sp.]|uniref:DUF3280 domain-containing protein n=1 Tax=Rhodoblastus sp. TaxID=1962975 RepID=UPI003F9B2733
MQNRFFFRRRLLLAVAVLSWGGASLAFAASGDPSPIKIAVFNFEIDDFSAGAGIAGNAAADLEHLDQATSQARRLLAESGRYSLVDVARAQGDSVAARELRQCNGCEAAIAQKLGADQSFVGVVTRISRTEFTVRFQIRDARTGAVIASKATDLRLGADYAWSRAAASLIKDRLLNDS